MPLHPGYNFVRSGATNEYMEALRAHSDPEAECISVVEFLRMVEQKRRPRHACVQVEGLQTLWDSCPDPEALEMKLNALLRSTRVSWIRNNLRYVYFVFPADVEFIEGHTFQLQVEGRPPISLGRAFGAVRRVAADHYNKSHTSSS